MFTSLAIADPDLFLFGRCPHPVTCPNGVEIGNGEILPEINFTLPPMAIDKSTLEKVLNQYRTMVEGICQRAVELQTPALVMEIELLPDLTMHPEWGGRVTSVAKDIINDYQANHDLKVALRMTPVDIREDKRPPALRSGSGYERLMESFEACAEGGADILSIESIGGKEVSDQAIMEGNVAGVVFALGILGVRDMQFLWKKINAVCQNHGIIAGGDTACAFGNTAMVLADKQNISKVFASIVRTMSAVRSLVAYEEGAVGPGKDCGYENIILKAITGYPMSLEGKSAACAHLSFIGNIASATADLWSNESVQNVRLLAGQAPVVSLEQLVYDCRLLNTAARNDSGGLTIRDWLVKSDERLDPQAYILSPQASIEFAKTIVEAESHYQKTVAVARHTIDVLRRAYRDGTLKESPLEIRWMDMIDQQLRGLPEDEQQFIDQSLEQWNTHMLPYEYGL